MRIADPTAVAPESDYLFQAQVRMEHARNYLAWQKRLVLPELGQRVIEVGCGVGNFTEALLDREAVMAVDVEPGYLARLKQRYPDQPNLSTFACDAGTGKLSGLAGFRGDSCVCLNVLEHIRDDQEALRGMRSILAPGGVVVLLVPAFQSLYGPIDRNLGHYRRYRRTSMLRLVEAAGLRVQTMRYMNLIGFFAWWASALTKRESHSEGQIRFYDRHVIPWIERMENGIQPAFGQSLFVVLRKP